MTHRAGASDSLRLFILLGSLSAFVAVGAGAFGAHTLKERLTPEMLAVFETGARYQMYHALALVAVAVASVYLPGRLVKAAGWLFVLGTVIFSGTLYALSMTGLRWLGAITPVGGVCFLAGWLCLAVGACRKNRPEEPPASS